MNRSAVLCIFLLLCLSAQANKSIWSAQMQGLMACFENNDKSLSENNNSFIYTWNNEGQYQDVEGDALFEFVDLTKLKVAIDNNKISINISLSHIPYVFIFDHANVPADELEYEWAVYFDIDASSDDEISISMSSYKNQDREETLGNMLHKTQKDVWLWVAEGGTSLSSNIVADEVDRTTFSLTIDKNEHEALRKITTKTPVRFSAAYNFSGKLCEDFFPDIINK